MAKPTQEELDAAKAAFVVAQQTHGPQSPQALAAGQAIIKLMKLR